MISNFFSSYLQIPCYDFNFFHNFYRFLAIISTFFHAIFADFLQCGAKVLRPTTAVPAAIYCFPPHLPAARVRAARGAHSAGPAEGPVPAAGGDCPGGHCGGQRFQGGNVVTIN